MGWTGITHNRNKAYTDKEIKEELFRDIEVVPCAKTAPTGHKVVQYSRVGNVIYMAVEKTENDSKVVFAVVFRIRNLKNEFVYKDMDETMCPFDTDAPISLIKKLTKTDNDLANEWRNKCLKKATNKKELERLFNEGKSIKVKGEIMFGDEDYHTFEPRTVRKNVRNSKIWVNCKEGTYIRTNDILGLEFIGEED